MTDSKTATERVCELLDEFEHECFMIRVEASETRAKDEVVRKAYERQRDETAQAIAATLGSGECEMRESSEYVECKVQTFTCSACGWHGAIDDLFASDTIPNFCPNCGARVVG